MSEITGDKQTGNDVSSVAQNENLLTANQLWKLYGKPLGIPLNQWITNEIMKAKSSGIYKEGMNINDIVNGNRQIIAGKQDTSSTTTTTPADSGNSFKLFGVNGYVVAVVAVVGIAAVVYWASGKLVKTQTA